jgi:hypothetical protein
LVLSTYSDWDILVMAAFALVALFLIIPAVIYLTQGPVAAREPTGQAQRVLLRELKELKEEGRRIADAVERLEKRPNRRNKRFMTLIR